MNFEGSALLLCSDPGVPFYGKSGASVHLRAIAEELRSRGDLVVSVAKVGQGPSGDLVREVAAPRVPRRVRFVSRVLAGRTGRYPRCDWIYERLSACGDVGHRLANRWRVPRVVEVNAPISLERQRFDPCRYPGWLRKIERASLLSAHRVVVVSPWLGQWVQEQGVGAHRVRVVPNGANKLVLGGRKSKREALRLTEDTLAVVVLGQRKTGQWLYPVYEILQRLPHCKVFLLGDGPVVHHPRAVHLAYTDDLSSWLSAMDVGLDLGFLPYRDPLRLAMYGAAGLPMVARSTYRRPLLIAVEEAGSWTDAVVAASSLERVVHLRSWQTVIDEIIG